MQVYYSKKKQYSAVAITPDEKILRIKASSRTEKFPIVPKVSFHKDKYWRFISSFIDNPSTFGRINKWCSDEEKRWREFYAWKKIWITDISGISSPGTTSAEVCVYHRIEEYVERTENFDSMIGKLEKELGAREGKFEPKYGFAAEYYSTRKGS